MCIRDRIELFKKYTVTQFTCSPLVVMLFGGGGDLEACPDEYFRLLFISKKQKLKNLYHHNKTHLMPSFSICEKGLLDSKYFKQLFITNEPELKNKVKYHNKTRSTLPIQGGKACDALSGRFSGFIYLFARNYLPLPSLYPSSQPLSHPVTQSLNHLTHHSLNHLIPSHLIPLSPFPRGALL